MITLSIRITDKYYVRSINLSSCSQTFIKHVCRLISGRTFLYKSVKVRIIGLCKPIDLCLWNPTYIFTFRRKSIFFVFKHRLHAIITIYSNTTFIHIGMSHLYIYSISADIITAKLLTQGIGKEIFPIFLIGASRIVNITPHIHSHIGSIQHSISGQLFIVTFNNDFICKSRSGRIIICIRMITPTPTTSHQFKRTNVITSCLIQ